MPTSSTAFIFSSLPPVQAAPVPEGHPPLPETPLDALGPDLREEVILQEQTFYLLRPSESDQLLDHPSVRAAYAADEYLPYWADLWPAARMLGKVILRGGWPAGAEAPRALEVGCGLGLPGIVALSAGLRVTFSDYDRTALLYAGRNAQLNGFTDFELLQMDWRFPPSQTRFPLILASDLIYEMRNIEPLIGLIEAMLEPGGTCLLTDQDRVPSSVLRSRLSERRLPFTTETLRAGEPGGRRVKGTLYRISLPG